MNATVLLPVAARELSVAARRKATWWTRTLFVLVIAGVTAAMLVSGAQAAFTTPARLAQTIFNLTSVLALAFCWFSGVALTADSLSAERREGTLGLLFLTDLRGFDVVLGKLAASSTLVVYGVLGVLPVLAVPLMMGGVTFAEFGRTTLVLLASLWLSLTWGLCVSAFARDSRTSMGATLAGLIVLTAGASFAGWLVQLLTHWLPAAKALRAASPLELLWGARSARYGLFTPTHFWAALGAFFSVGWLLLGVASWRLPRRLDESSAATEVTRARRPAEALPHNRPLPAGPTGMRHDNPYAWLMRRFGGSTDALGWILSLGLLAWSGLVAVTLLSSSQAGSQRMFVATVFTAYGLHVLAKVTMALFTTRRLSEDARSGALELLLATPLPPEHIVDGVRTTTRERFRRLTHALTLVNGVLLVLVWTFDPLNMRADDAAIFTAMFGSGLVLLRTDLRLAVWVGLRESLRRRHHARALLATAARLLLPGWLGYFGIFLFALSARSVREGTIFFLVCLWLTWCLAAHLMFVRGARRELREFRRLAAEPPENHPRLGWPMTPATAPPRLTDLAREAAR